MKLFVSVISLQCYLSLSAFVPHVNTRRSPHALNGYLDDLSSDLNKETEVVNPDEDSREANKMEKKDIQSYGPGNFEGFVDFDEFDGGDGQMGVAGDGDKGLEKMGGGPQIASRSMSAKNAWGTSTGYAQELIDSGTETARAQQIENWRNQREVHAKNLDQKYMTDAYDAANSNADEDWRSLAKFGVERNQDFDMNEVLGEVTLGQIDEVIEIHTNMNQMAYKEFSLKNDFMGFADFRATIVGQDPGWSVDPVEGSLSKEPTEFIVRYMATVAGVSQSYLVIETEDMKKTYQLLGTTG